MSQQEIENAIFNGDLPKKTFNISGISFTFIINEEQVPYILEEWVEFFENCLFITGRDTRPFLLSLPHPIFILLIKYYNKFHKDWLASVENYIEKIMGDPGSKTIWKVCKKVSADKVLKINNNKLNTAQYYWAMHNIHHDESEQSDLITNIFNALKPWLDFDLWKAQSDNDTNTRVNRLYDDQIARFEGTLDEIVME